MENSVFSNVSRGDMSILFRLGVRLRQTLLIHKGNCSVIVAQLQTETLLKITSTTTATTFPCSIRRKYAEHCALCDVTEATD